LELILLIVGEDWRQSHALPLRVICSRECLIGATKYDDHWIIPNIERVKRLGGGAAASVWLADLFGAKVAMKEWELGAKDPPPPDFWVELSVLKSLRHENLVSFVGAIGKTGTALIVLEFLNGGSMDKFLNIMAPPDPLDPTPPSTEASDPNIPRNIQFKDRLQMAIDGAKGILFLHDHNKIHRFVLPHLRSYHKF
jgi:serine/threonine protein kinase